MNPYAALLAEERITQFRAEAAQRRPATNAGRRIRHMTGWALIHIGLVLVTSSARRRHPALPELP